MTESTIPETAGIRGGSAHETARSLGLAIVWCPAQPDLLGAFLPVRAGTWILGRGAARADDPFPRLVPLRQRPGASSAMSPLSLEAISRVQLIISEAHGGERLCIEREGRCAVSVNGSPTDRGTVGVGDVLEIGSQISLVCLERSDRIPGHVEQPGHPFGAPDVRGIVGESELVWELRSQLAFVAPRKEHVFVHGETGTGKELVARALHALSRRTGPFVSRNAATIPETLVDAELFGNAASYPNPGMRERKGLVGAADDGTLFLDEFAELPAASQTHLLRVLDSGEYQRLGETQLRSSTLRLVAATNQDPTTLRSDLYARFTFHVEVPSLRQRPEDIPLLARHLVLEIARNDPALAERLLDSLGEPRIDQAFVTELVREPPRGNVRELRNLLWRGIADGAGDVIRAPTRRSETSTARGPDALDEPQRVREALERHGGSLEETWRALGLSSRFALMRLMKRHGITVARRVR